MKELSIKEKAERYDKLLVKLYEAKVDNNVCDERYCCVIDDIVPELKESEDERIRKELLDHIRHSAHNTPADKFNAWVAWLEKQGNKKDNLSVDFVLGYLGIKPAYKDGNAWCILLGDNIQEGICGFGGTKEEALVAFMKELIEKQGEQIPANSAKTCKDDQKPNPYSGTSFDYDGHTWGMCAMDNGVKLLLDGELKAFLSLEKSFIYPIHPQPELAPKSALEAAKEEKVDNANKVEPKDYNDIDPHFGKPIDKVEPKFKVGDWVVTDKCDTVQIRAVNNGYYTLYNGMIFNMSYVDKCWHLWTIADAKDGDVLSNGKMIVIFKHFEEPSYRQHIVAYIGLDTNGDIQITDDTWNLGIDKAKPATKEQRDLLFQKMKEEGYEWDAEKKEPKKIEQKPWSEEDDDDAWLNDIISKAECNLQLNKDEINWLKFLKDRYTWKPSKEQIMALRWVLNHIPYDSHKEEISGLLEQLKKLK